jgi:hypothetical protein
VTFSALIDERTPVTGAAQGERRRSWEESSLSPNCLGACAPVLIVTGAVATTQSAMVVRSAARVFSGGAPMYAQEVPRSAVLPQRAGLDPLASARRTELHLPANLALAGWRRVGQQIALLSSSSAWWLGD